MLRPKAEGILLAGTIYVPMRSTCDEPMVMWRVLHDDGRSAHAMIIPRGEKAAALWFILGSPQDSREFNTLHGAIRWLERKLVTLQVSGWHLWNPPKDPDCPT